MATKKYVSDSKLQYFWNKIKTYITNAISGKQDALTAGTHITIANNVISANIDDYATQEDIVTMLSVLGINTYILDNDEYETFDDGGGAI